MTSVHVIPSTRDRSAAAAPRPAHPRAAQRMQPARLLVLRPPVRRPHRRPLLPQRLPPGRIQTPAPTGTDPECISRAWPHKQGGALFSHPHRRDHRRPVTHISADASTLVGAVTHKVSANAPSSQVSDVVGGLESLVTGSWPAPRCRETFLQIIAGKSCHWLMATSAKPLVRGIFKLYIVKLEFLGHLRIAAGPGGHRYLARSMHGRCINAKTVHINR
jgi:hypothetical protein